MFLRYIKRTFKLVGLVVLVLLFTRTIIIEPGAVNGRSMETTFLDNEMFLVNKLALFFRTPERGDIVQAKGLDPGEVIIKRVIGLPGEELAIHDNHIYLIGADGSETLLQEPYLDEGVITLSVNGEPTRFTKIPDHAYFLVGDNRTMSVDSRASGAFHRSDIYGLVMKLPF